MDVKINLDDIDEIAAVTISDCEENTHIFITLVDIDKELTAKISIDEIKLALRKITAK